MVDDGVVSVAGHSLGKAVQNSLTIIFTFKITAFALLDELVDSTGLEQIGKFRPLVDITVVPEISDRK